MPQAQRTASLTASGWVAFVHAQAATNVLQTRLFLVCSLWRHWLDRNGTRVDCPALVDAMPSIHAQLRLNAREQLLLTSLAVPSDTQLRSTDRVARLLFHGAHEAAQREWRRLRGCLLATVAVTLGTAIADDGGGHVLQTHLLDPGSLVGTFGLAGGDHVPIGSGAGVGGALGYDCSTLVNVERREMVKSREPIAAQGVFSTLFLAGFGAMAVSLAVFQDQCDRCLGPVFTDFYKQDVRVRPGHPPALTKAEWLRQQVWQRLEDAWAVLRSVLGSGDDAALVAMGALSGFATKVAALAPADRPPTFGSTVARSAFETWWRNECYQPCADRVRDTRREVAAFLRLHPFHGVLSEARRVLPVGDEVMPRLITCVANHHAQSGGDAQFDALRTLPARMDYFKHLRFV